MPRFPLLVLLVSLPGCSWVAGELPDAAPQAQSGGAAGISGSGAASGSGGESSGGAAGQAGSAAGGSAAGGSATGGSAGSGNSAGTGGAAGSGGTSGCAKPCDCDDDGQEAESCGGTDCDDHDERVYQGQTAYFSEASTNPQVLFDFDCSGKIERDPELDKEVNCGLLNLGNCGGQGFSSTAPTCGNESDWGECRSNGLVCKHVVLSSRVMACH